MMRPGCLRDSLQQRNRLRLLFFPILCIVFSSSGQFIDPVWDKISFDSATHYSPDSLVTNTSSVKYSTSLKPLEINSYSNGTLDSYISFGYDVSGNRIYSTYHFSSKLVDSTSFSYDSKGNVSTSLTFDSSGDLIDSVRFQYNGDNLCTLKVTNVIIKGQAPLVNHYRYSYFRDSLNRISKIQEDNGSYITQRDYTFDSSGLIVASVCSSGTSLGYIDTYTYDKIGRLQTWHEISYEGKLIGTDNGTTFFHYSISRVLISGYSIFQPASTLRVVNYRSHVVIWSPEAFNARLRFVDASGRTIFVSTPIQLRAGNNLIPTNSRDLFRSQFTFVQLMKNN